MNAVPALVDRKADIGMSSLMLPDSEIAKIPGGKTRDDIERVVALDGVLILAEPDNPVKALSLCEIARLFSGKIKDWSEIRGVRGGVSIHHRKAASGTAVVFGDLVLGTCGVTLSPDAIPHSSFEDLARAVAANKGAIGFAPISKAGGAAKRLRIKGACGVESAPTRFAVQTEDYPLSRRLYLYAPYALPGNAQKFLDFAVSSDRAQELIATSETAIAQSIEVRREDDRIGDSVAELGLEADSEAMRQLLQDTAGGERLSITYRFKSNSYDLDSKARQDILRLARRLRTIAGGKAVLLAGFTDSDGAQNGPQGGNRALAAKRAAVVKEALRNAGAGLSGEAFLVEGYGEILPVACNDNDLGKEKNRRVEVWLLDRRAFQKGMAARGVATSAGRNPVRP